MNSSTSNILMIRPVRFGYNAETAVNNAFQAKQDQQFVQQKALQEFDNFTLLLEKNGIAVTVVSDTEEPHTPDSIFPNNWISFHEDGTVVLYPMFAANRRQERKPAILQALEKKFSIRHTINLSDYELKNMFLEGTGSMVLDRASRIAYACLSPRTHPELFHQWCHTMNYTGIAFTATDENGKEIYHTNVMMCVADQYVVICLDAIADTAERSAVLNSIVSSGKQLVCISHSQMNRFAGNMLQVKNKAGEKFLVMSSQAYQSLNQEQIALLHHFNPILHSDISTIESNGGGSTRCMMAEIFLPVQA